MSELGDLLELLHGAAGRVSSVQSRWRLWRHDHLVREAFTTHAQETGGRTYATQLAGPSGAVDRRPEHTEELRFWWQSPASLREECDPAERPQAQLSTTLGDTLIVMSSDTLTADDLIRLAARLTPASAHPPRI